MNIDDIAAKTVAQIMTRPCTHGTPMDGQLCRFCMTETIAEAMKSLAAKVAETLTVQDVRAAAEMNHDAERIKAAVRLMEMPPTDTGPRLRDTTRNYLTRVFDVAAQEQVRDA